MSDFKATVERGSLLVELAIREAARRKHKSRAKVSAREIADVLGEMGFKLAVTP